MFEEQCGLGEHVVDHERCCSVTGQREEPSDGENESRFRNIAPMTGTQLVFSSATRKIDVFLLKAT